jgi:hypothetical protein
LSKELIGKLAISFERGREAVCIGGHAVMQELNLGGLSAERVFGADAKIHIIDDQTSKLYLDNPFYHRACISRIQLRTSPSPIDSIISSIAYI